MPTHPAITSPSHPSRPSQADASDVPPSFAQRRQTANVFAPPSVSSQQSPHTGRRQRAHGPTAVTPQCEQRASGPSPPPAGMSEDIA